MHGAPTNRMNWKWTRIHRKYVFFLLPRQDVFWANNELVITNYKIETKIYYCSIQFNKPGTFNIVDWLFKNEHKTSTSTTTTQQNNFCDGYRQCRERMLQLSRQYLRVYKHSTDYYCIQTTIKCDDEWWLYSNWLFFSSRKYRFNEKHNALVFFRPGKKIKLRMSKITNNYKFLWLWLFEAHNNRWFTKYIV